MLYDGAGEAAAPQTVDRDPWSLPMKSAHPLLRALLVAAMGVCLPLGNPCRALGPEEDPSPDRDLTPAAREAIHHGIQFLVQNQREDGSWGNQGGMGRYPVAMTALSGLALLENGSLPASGPQAATVRRAIEFLLAQADPQTGLIGGDESGRPMFGHGFATLFLAQVYGSEGDPALRTRIRQALERAVALTARVQSASGGWYYTPTAESDEGAVTVTQMQGLRACADAGIPVPPETVQRAQGYVAASANPDGGIAYRASEEGPSRPAITAAAIVTLYSAGLYGSELARQAFRYATETIPLSGGSSSGGGHFFYAHLYLSQATYFEGGQGWRDYFRQIRDWLVSNQKADGSWEGDFFGTTYGTAVALLILQLPYNTLPIVQR